MTAAIVVLVAASAERVVWWALQTSWSRADETVASRMGLRAAIPGYSYRAACETWLSDERNQKWPGQVRYAHVLLLGALYRLTKSNTYKVPSAVQTAAGIASVWLAWWIAVQLFGEGIAEAAALLVAVSPLQLHLGRRALQDAGVCALTLAALALCLTPWPALAALPCAALLAYKETTAPVLPALGLFGWWVGVPWRELGIVLAGGPLLYWAGFSVATRRPLMLWRFARAVVGARHDDYGREQEGAPHRLPVDLLLLSPIPVALAMRSEVNAAAVFVVAFLFCQSCVPILRSVRMVTAAEAMLRVVAVGVLAQVDTVLGYSVAGAIAAADMMIFERVFQRGKVYDPTTRNLVVALGMTRPIK